jgi:hypothetical protein
MSVVLLSLSLMAVMWLLICFIGHGYANTVDILALWLHKHADRMRGMHDRRRAIVSERWVKCLENAVVDVLEGIKYDK